MDSLKNDDTNRNNNEWVDELHETFEPIDASKLKLRKPPAGSKIANLKETIEQQVTFDIFCLLLILHVLC